MLACVLSAGCGRIGLEYLDQHGDLRADGADGAAAPDMDEPDDAGPDEAPWAPAPFDAATEPPPEPPDDWTGGLAVSDGGGADLPTAPPRDAGIAPPVDAGAPAPLDSGSARDDASAPADASPAPADAATDAPPAPADAAADAPPAPVDAGPPVPPSAGAPALSCREPGLIACDDFDGNRSGTTVSLVGGALSSGGFASAPVSPESPRAAAHVSFNAVTSGALYLRFSLYVPANVPVTGLTIARLGRFDVSSGFGVDVRLVSDGAVEFATSAGVVRGSASYRIARDRWVCVLVQADTIDATSGSARVSFDGAPVASAANIDTEPSAGIAAAAAGVENVLGGQEAATLYVDGVLLVSQPPPPCP